jgi:hypothetical protein
MSPRSTILTIVQFGTKVGHVDQPRYLSYHVGLSARMEPSYVWCQDKRQLL